MPDHPVLDPVLATLSYEAIEMLRTFREKKSFREVANEFGRDERTVSRQLVDVEKAFWETQQVHILERGPHHKNYRLTPAGEIFISMLEPIADVTRSAVDAAAAATRRIPVLCTSNCLSYFHDLSEALPRERTFDILPLPRRTADIDLTSVTSSASLTNVCLVSALMSSEQRPAVGTVSQLTDRIEILPLELDQPRLLSADDLGFRRPVTVREAADAGITFLTPAGGVAFEFLNRSFPEWRKLRPFQHVAVPDLDYGLKCLANRLIPRSAMVVHHIDASVAKLYNVDPVHFYDFATSQAHQLLAVTGVLHVHQESDHGDLSEIVWDTARSLWSEKEHIL